MEAEFGWPIRYATAVLTTEMYAVRPFGDLNGSGKAGSHDNLISSRASSLPYSKYISFPPFSRTRTLSFTVISRDLVQGIR
jgi:hypothetical protein